jgi:signal transduction histidine kinase
LQLTPRWRAVVAGLVMAAIGFVALTIYHGTEQVFGCTSSLVRTLHVCGFGVHHHAWAQVALGVAILGVVVAACWGLGLWVLWPIRGLTAMVDRMGPQNLAERAPVGSRSDETTALTQAVNQMMNRLAEGYEGQRTFAANASHELRTPLAVQRTLIEVSMSAARTPKQLELLTEQLLATNERNELLIEGLLVLSESDRGLVSRTPQRLDAIVGSVVAAHQDLADQAEVSVTATLADRLVLGERVLLERLVTNLVRNAVLYNVPGGEVRVAVGTSPALVVENSGPMIAADSVAGLFEPFRRGSGERTSHGKGAGLGLTICRSICRAHDGSIEAQANPAGGLRVEVRMP